MKRLKVFSLLLLTVLAANAQQNVFWQQDFWKQSPSVELVKSEIQKGNDAVKPNARAFDATTYAINADAPNETIKYLINLEGNGVKKITHDGRTYLHWATSRGNIDIINFLITKGADIRYKDTKGSEPLQFGLAAATKNALIFDAYFKAGLNPKTTFENGANLLLLSIAYDTDFKAANYLISKGLSLKNQDANGSTLFDYAARSGNIDFLKIILAKGVQPTPASLLFATVTGRGANTNSSDVFHYLTDELKLNPNYADKEGNNVLHALVRRPNQEKLVSYFIDKGTDVNKANEEGITPLMAAANANQNTNVALLLSKTNNINAEDKEGQTALTYAVANGSLTMVNAMIDKGADVKVLDKNGYNLAYHLVQNYRPNTSNDDFSEKLALLQAKGIAVETNQQDGSSLYHPAVVKGDIALLNKLANLKIDINAKNKEGMTALHKAALLAKNEEILKFLVAKNADKSIKTEFGETAYELAKDNQYLTKAKIDLTFLKN